MTVSIDRCGCVTPTSFSSRRTHAVYTCFDSWKSFIIFRNEGKMNISFSLPKAKKYCTGHVQVSPFPLTEISDECDRRQFVGIFTGMSVEVFNVDDIRELYEKGFYGSGAKTKVQSKILAPNTLKNSLFATNSQYMAKKELERKLGNQNPNEVTLKVLADGFGQHSTGELTFVTETDPFPFEESLILSLEEAFFLHNSLRCLKIVNFEQTSETTTEEFLNTCCALKKNFILYFTAYHYYRSKGWIVKDGLKFGGDFCKQT